MSAPFDWADGVHPLEVEPDLDHQRQLYDAVHALLLARVLHGQESKQFLEAINRVIEVHDTITDIYQRAFGDS